MFVLALALITTIVFPLSAHAARYFCPYELTVDGVETVRTLSINRLADALRTAQGTPAYVTPWDEDEVAGETRNAPGRGLITVPDGVLAVDILKPVIAGGAGCTVVPPAYVSMPARPPRPTGTPGILTYDHQDMSQPSIGRRGPPQRGAGIWELRSTLAWWLSVPYAQADAINAVLDDFNRADENPITTNWTNRIDSDLTANIRIVSNQVTTSAALASAYYDIMTYALPAEAYFTMSTVSSAAHDLYVVHAGAGTATPDGYRVRQNNGSSWSVERMDDGVFTTLGSSVTQSYVSGNKVRLYRSASVIISEHYNGTAWAQIRNETDTTYTTAVSLGIGINSSSTNLDDFGGGTVGGAARRRKFWFP